MIPYNIYINPPLFFKGCIIKYITEKKKNHMIIYYFKQERGEKESKEHL